MCRDLREGYTRQSKAGGKAQRQHEPGEARAVLGTSEQDLVDVEEDTGLTLSQVRTTGGAAEEHDLMGLTRSFWLLQEMD